jgi:hypothetical protein
MKTKNFILKNSNGISKEALLDIVSPLLSNNMVAYITDEDIGYEYIVIKDENGVGKIKKVGVSVSDALRSTIVAIVLDATKDFVTVEQVPSPLSNEQVETIKSEILNSIIAENNGELTIKHEFATPQVKVITPLGETIEEGSFANEGEGVYRYTVDTDKLGSGIYSIEICVN